MSGTLADHVLELVRGMGFHVGVTQVERPFVGQVWRMEARSNLGETWIAEDADYYRAAVLLAESVGAELEE